MNFNPVWLPANAAAAFGLIITAGFVWASLSTSAVATNFGVMRVMTTDSAVKQMIAKKMM